MKEYKSEASINKVLAQLQLAGAAEIECPCEDEEAKFEVLLREALKSENEAIEIYLKLEKKAKHIGSKALAKAFAELQKDEREHIGNLQLLMKCLCEDAVQTEKEGEAEEAKLQAEVEPAEG